jgi:uncharacterized protein (TIGR03083 family)
MTRRGEGHVATDARATLRCMSTQDQITAERHRAADLLEILDDDQLRTASLCGGWTVRDVFAHELMPLITPLGKFMIGMVKARGSFDKANDQLSRRVAERPVKALASGLRQRATSSFHAPGFPLEAALLDLLIHGQDIRRPLGLTRDFDPDAQRKALTLLTEPKAERAFVRKGRLAGLTWRAEDIDWTFGSGPEVVGSGEAIMLAMAGRKVALDDLRGEGLAELRSRR